MNLPYWDSRVWLSGVENSSDAYLNLLLCHYSLLVSHHLLTIQSWFSFCPSFTCWYFSLFYSHCVNSVCDRVFVLFNHHACADPVGTSLMKSRLLIPTTSPLGRIYVCINILQTLLLQNQTYQIILTSMLLKVITLFSQSFKKANQSGNHPGCICFAHLSYLTLQNSVSFLILLPLG